ncbi:unnamed protein product [Linum tenue]|uniref:F-box protein At3g26010-like beta-propeller domain-containing protein n=1 Tax=Linum tenue TaxID=586396 RepID=A0AAV0P632_9ROSI|nr:unnamed protein product [Linum tenue]
MATSTRKLISSSSSISKLEANDLLVEILIRLPDPRSAVRCKSICKGWNSVISAPDFSRRLASHHRSLSAANNESEQPVLTPAEVRQLILSFLPFPDDAGSKFLVLDSIKDLLLLGFWGNETCQELRRTHLVCNPFTKQWISLPLPPKMAARPHRYRWTVKLVCKPFISLGEEDQVFPGRFQVVRMYTPLSLYAKVEVYMFCSRSGRWARFVLDHDHHSLRCFSPDHVALNNGKLYWANSWKRFVKWDPFSLDHNSTLPIVIDGPKFSGRLSGPWTSAGALHVTCTRWERSNESPSSWIDLSVWRLEEEEHGGGWRKQNEVTNLEGVCKITSNSETKVLDHLRFQDVVGMHPDKPGIVFLSAFGAADHYKEVVVFYDFGKNKLEFLAYEEVQSYYTYLNPVVQPRVTFWPSMIPNYKMLQRGYNGSYNCWLSTM